MLNVYSPFDKSLIKSIPMVGIPEIENALEIAHGLYSDRSKWLPKHKRIEILDRVSSIMKESLEELIRTAAREGGKPYIDSKVEVLRAINGVKLASEHIGQLKGQEIPMGLTAASENRIAFTRL